MNNFIAFIAGMILPFAFAPFQWFPIAFISPAILLSLWLHARPLSAWLQGWCFGLGFFGIGVSWVYASVYSFSNSNILLSILITFFFISILALFIAFQGFTFSLFFRKKNVTITALFSFPAWWVIWEWLRSIFFIGFPWLFLGYSQITSCLKGFGPIFGVYGISLIVTLISSCIYLFFSYKKRDKKIALIIFMILFFIIGRILIFITWTKSQSTSLRVGLVQGNIDQHLKWGPNNLYSILHTYHSETKKNWGCDLIIWPEAAIPIYPQQVLPFLQSLNKEAKKHNTALVIGIPIYHRKTKQSFNGLMILGNSHGLYLKQHLVPFGESYTSSKVFNLLFDLCIKYFNIPMSDLSQGPKNQKSDFIKNIPFAPFICYEIAYPTEVLNNSMSKQFIIVISDDSWFDRTFASSQQLQIAQMRALEMNRYLLYCTNTGITSIINPEGKIIKSAPINQKFVLTGHIRLVIGKTPLMKWNYYPVTGIVILFLLLEFL